MRNRTELSYRIAAVDMDSPTGLLLALYDTLAGDLLRAITALEANNIEQRCSELNHAYVVLGQLESWVSSESHTPLDDSLRAFYGHMRAGMLEASIKKSTSMLRDLVQLVVQIRAAWQQRESLAGVGGQAATALHPEIAHSVAPAERFALSQSF